MKVWTFALLIVALPLASAFNASDYVQLIDSKCTSDFGSVIDCYTTYNITNPSGLSYTIDPSNFKLLWRTLRNQSLIDSIPSIRNMNLQRWNGAFWVDLNLGGSVILAPRTSYLVRVTAQKLWVPSDVAGEFRMDNVDNVISAFGFNYTQFAWWNNSYSYKKNFTVLMPNRILSNLSFMFTTNLTIEAEGGKLDLNGSCFRLVDDNETGELVFEHEQSNLSITNYTAFLFYNFTTSNINYTFWGYYGNLTSCSEGNGNINNAWNQTGAMIVSHLGFDKINGSSFYDSAGGDQNFSIVGSLPLVKTPFGMGFQKIGTQNNYAVGSGKKFNNLAQGSVVMWYNVSSLAVINPYIITRGNFTAGGPGIDLAIDISSSRPSCSLDGTGTRAWDAAAISLNTWYLIVCTWNTTGVYNFRNGAFAASSAFTTGLPNSAPKSQLTLGEDIDLTTNIFNGSITGVMFFNRSLSEQEIAELYNSSLLTNGTEQSNITSPSQLTVQAFDELTGNQIYFNASFTNGTASYSTPNSLTYLANTSVFPQNSNTIIFQNASYYPRSIVGTVNNNTSNFSAYLLPLSYLSAIYVRIHVQSAIFQPIQSATVVFQRSIGGSTVTTASCLTDSTGTCAQYLDSLANYQISISAGGYNSQTNAITPVGNDYTFTLSSSNVIIYPGSYANLTYSLLPFLLNLPTNWTIINWTIISDDSQLASWGLNISYGGAIIYNSSNTTSPSGGTILVNVTTIGRVGNLTATGFFQKAGQPILYYSQRYFIYQNATSNSGSLDTLMSNVYSQGKSPFIIGFLIIIIVALLAGGLNALLVVGAGMGLITAFLLLFFAGFLLPIGVDLPEWGFFGLLVLLGAALLKLRSGQ